MSFRGGHARPEHYLFAKKARKEPYYGNEKDDGGRYGRQEHEDCG